MDLQYYVNEVLREYHTFTTLKDMLYNNQACLAGASETSTEKEKIEVWLRWISAQTEKELKPLIYITQPGLYFQIWTTRPSRTALKHTIDRCVP